MSKFINNHNENNIIGNNSNSAKITDNSQINNEVSQSLKPLLNYSNSNNDIKNVTVTTTTEGTVPLLKYHNLNNNTTAEKTVPLPRYSKIINHIIPKNNRITASIDSQDNICLFKNNNDPKISIERLKQYILKKQRLLFCDELRVYNSEKGCYIKISYHDAIVLIYSLVDEDIKFYLSPKLVKETYKALKYEPSIQYKSDSIDIQNKFYLNCKNGVINLKNLICNYPFLEPHNPNRILLTCVNANFIKNRSIRGTFFEYFLNSITRGDSSLIHLIQQVIGYLLSNLNNAKKALIFYGKSNTGKSVLLKLLSFICGEENISNVCLQDLSNPKYTAELFGKSINICNELPDRDITDTNIFKSLTSENDKVSARRLYEQPFSFYNKSKLLFATNNLPNIKYSCYKDNSAYFNRLLIIPFLFSIPEDKQDKDLINKLLEETDIIFSWAVNGLISYMQNNYSFDICDVSQTALNHYRNNSNTFTEFINLRCTLSSNSYVYMDMLFQAYKKFCDDYCLDVPKNNDKKYLKNLIINNYNLQYKKIHRSNSNKYGFIGICLN